MQKRPKTPHPFFKAKIQYTLKLAMTYGFVILYANPI